MMKSFIKKYGKYLVLLAILFGGCTTDLQVKKVAKSKFRIQEVEIIKDVFDLTYVENHSVAFGFLTGIKRSIRVPLILTITIGIGLFGLYFVWKLRKYRSSLLIALIVILAGAFGNITDRLRHGFVTDFLHVYYKDKFDFPVFNIADVLINIGIIMLLFQARYFDLAVKQVMNKNKEDEITTAT